MNDQQRIELYTSTLMARGAISLSAANAELCKRGLLLPATYEPQQGRPDLVRVTRLTEAVRL